MQPQVRDGTTPSGFGDGAVCRSTVGDDIDDVLGPVPPLDVPSDEHCMAVVNYLQITNRST